MINLNSNDNNYISNIPSSTIINKKKNKKYYIFNDNYNLNFITIILV